MSDTPSAPTTGADAPPPLDELRRKITDIDADLIALLARRREFACQVARSKATVGRAIRDQVREEDLLVGLIEQGHECGLDAAYVTRVFHLIIDDSVRLQQALLIEHGRAQAKGDTIRVAFQGDTGSYSHVAVRQHFANRTDRLSFLGFADFAHAIGAVESGEADYAMLPIENTTSGGINEVYDLLMHTPLSVVGEETLSIEHCLLAPPGVALESLNRIYAHPQGFAQCSHFVGRQPHCRLESLETAEAVRRAGEEADRRAGAIASVQAGELYGLVPLAKHIANQRENVTRFLCVAREAQQVPAQVGCKTSLVMATSDAAGSLVEALSLFRDAGISMTKLESRPIMGNPWEEMFYVDLEANVDAPAMKDTLARLASVTRYLKVLGCYPSNQIPVTRVAPERWVGALESDEDEAATSASTPTKATVRIGRSTLGEERFAVMAGVGAVAAASAAAQLAREAAQGGASALVAGLDESALAHDGASWRRQLKWLADAAQAADLPLVATVQRADQVAEAASVAQALRLDDRHMEHRDLLRAVGRTPRPVIITRARTATVAQLLRAVQVLVDEGNRQVVLCEAGISTFEHSGQGTLDLGAVARLRRDTQHPVVVDPRSALGTTGELAAPLLAAGRAAGAQGCLLALTASSAQESVAGELAPEYFAQLSRQLLAQA